jgi:hypothetical protein
MTTVWARAWAGTAVNDNPGGREADGEVHNLNNVLT